MIIFAECTNNEDNLPKILQMICARMISGVMPGVMIYLNSYRGTSVYIFKYLS